MPAIKLTKTNIDFDAIAAVKKELPFVAAAYYNIAELSADVAEWVEFYTTNRSALPVLSINTNAADNMQSVFSEYYQMLLAAVDQLLALPNSEISNWFRCSVSKHPLRFNQFIEFARATRAHPKHRDTVYGRFDAAVDTATGEITGIYEFNGDTPVMLFESVNLQNLISCALGNADAQQNEWWDQSVAQFSHYKGKSVAVVCDLNFIEDAATCETIAQMFEAAGATAYLTTLTGLNHDVLSIEKPFFVNQVNRPVDAVFMLLPWEEMIESGHDILTHWRQWYNQVVFFEPAWRWFISHKSMLAFVTHLLESDAAFKKKWGHLPHIKTTLDAGAAPAQHVRKPVLGRLSQNIEVVTDSVFTTVGMYASETMVYQPVHPTGKLSDGSNVIACGWITGNKCSTLAFRQFDNLVLDLRNERFIAHCLE